MMSKALPEDSVDEVYYNDIRGKKQFRLLKAALSNFPHFICPFKVPTIICASPGMLEFFN